jgi:hypothetical protein
MITPPHLHGIANLAILQSGEIPGANPLGLHSCLYLFDDTLHALQHDDAGNVDAYTPLPFLRPEQYIPMSKGIQGPRLGEPYHLAFADDADRPADATVAPWPTMATYLVGLLRYGPDFRNWLNNSGISGFHAVHFLGSKVPKHVSAGATEFDLLSMKGDIREMALLTKVLLTANPDWLTRNTVVAPSCDRGLSGP